MRSRSDHDLVYHLWAPAFLIFTPFISFVTYHRYSYTAPEIWISLAGLAAIALLCGLAGIAGGWPVRVILTAVLLVLWVDLQFDWLDKPNPTPKFRVMGVFLVVLIVSFAMRSHLSRIVAAMFATMLVFTVVLGSVGGGASMDARPAAISKPHPPAHPQLPILVHLILDEHIGVEGIPDDVPHGREMRGFLRDFFETYGFRVFARAYSHYANTYNSLANLVNFSSKPIGGALTSGDHPYVLVKNTYFELLDRSGYRIHVRQSNYMDFCTASKEDIVDCANREITGVKALESLDVPVSDKVRLIYRRFADLSALMARIGIRYMRLREAWRSAGWELPEWWFKEGRLGPIPDMALFDNVTEDVVRALPGDMFFVYIAMPHFPYVFDAMCDLRPVGEWEWSRNQWMPLNDRESRSRRYGLYLEQMRCLYRKLDAMFQAWQKAAIFDGLMIIVHGDHGSKINQLPPHAEIYQKLSHAEYIDAFSALFAVKGPRHPPGYDRRVAPIEQLLGEAVGGPAGDDEMPAEPYVFLWSRPARPMLRQPLPAFGDEQSWRVERSSSRSFW
jgi:hypothetical protein